MRVCARKMRASMGMLIFAISTAPCFNSFLPMNGAKSRRGARSSILISRSLSLLPNR